MMKESAARLSIEDMISIAAYAAFAQSMSRQVPNSCGTISNCKRPGPEWGNEPLSVCSSKMGSITIASSR